MHAMSEILRGLEFALEPESGRLVLIEFPLGHVEHNDASKQPLSSTYKLLTTKID